MDIPLRILVIEDCRADLLLLERHLKQQGLAVDCFCVAGMGELQGALDRGNWDIVLADYNVPGLNFLECLNLLRAHMPDVPVILVSGTVGEEKAIELLKLGVWDFVLKSNPARLVPAIEHSLRDAENRRARQAGETALHETYEKLRQFLAHSPAVLYILKIDGENLTHVVMSENIERLLGFNVAESSSYDWWLTGLHPEDRNRVLSGVKEGIRNGRGHSLEYRVRDRAGDYRWVEDNNRVMADETGRPGQAVGVWTDITERKGLQSEVAQQEKQLNSFFQGATAGMALLDRELRYIRINDSLAQMNGLSVEEHLGRTVREVLPELAPAVEPIFRRVLATGESVLNIEVTGVTPGDPGIQRHWMESFFPVVSGGGPLDRVGAIVVEITERKKAEAALEESEERYRSLFENALEGIFQATPDGRFLTLNPAHAKMYGYQSPEELLVDITDIAGQLYVDSSKRTEFIQMLAGKEAVKGYEVQLKRRDGSAFWVSMSARTVRNKAGEVLYIEGMSEDITERKDTEQKLNETMGSLRSAVGTTIQVLMAAVEARDPYTAGHQKRACDLARAIAAEMGLPPDRIEGIRMAGSIHDIGKISIPAEILSKPTRLSDVEMNLIRTHAQHGYEILKDVESPWPLARIVQQHHERMDGSGYPLGLKGDVILLEARIIAVADVVEAMASHRPYRPMLGVKAALAEIEQYKGVLYDAAVVDQCLRLFQEKAFEF